MKWMKLQKPKNVFLKKMADDDLDDDEEYRPKKQASKVASTPSSR